MRKGDGVRRILLIGLAAVVCVAAVVFVLAAYVLLIVSNAVYLTGIEPASFTSVEKNDGLIYLQGIEGRRAFNFVIHEATGRMTVSVSRDGLSVSVFGACTDTNL